MYVRTPMRMSADFSADTLQARRECHDIFKVMKKPTSKNTLPGKTIIQISRRDKEFYRQVKAKIVEHH